MQFYYIRSALYLLIHLCVSKTLQGSFLLSFFSKKRNRVPASPRIPRVPSSLGSGEEVGGEGITELIKDLRGTAANGYAVNVTDGAAEST